MSKQGIATEADCDAGLLHMVLALDAVRSLAADAGNRRQPDSGTDDSRSAAAVVGGGSDAPAGTAYSAPAAAARNAGSGGAKANRADMAASAAAAAVPLLCCGAADVEALLTHWERSPQPWRDSVAAGCR